MIRQIEELSLNALPALQTVFRDGWVLRFADGFTRRANCTNPLYPVSGDVAANIETCEALYTRRGLRPAAKLTPAAQPGDLDDRLARRGYTVEALTSLQTLELRRPTEPTSHIQIHSQLSEEWLSAYCSFNQTPRPHRSTLKRMLESLVPAAGYARLHRDGDIAACGLGVVQEGFIGLFDIVVAPHARRQGLGQALMAGLLAWGQKAGAHTAYLQVMLNNDAALRLYSSLGFQEAYRYWYRVKS